MLGVPGDENGRRFNKWLVLAGSRPDAVEFGKPETGKIPAMVVRDETPEKKPARGGIRLAEMTVEIAGEGLPVLTSA